MEYKRLTYPNDYDGRYEVPYIKQREAINRLGEFEDKIENGTLIEIPCKVGDTVYRIIGMPWQIEEQKIDSITLLQFGQIEILNEDGYELEIDTIYVTKKQAEARLKELKGE